MVKSIFELERRFDFDKEFKRLLDLLDQRIYNCEYRYFKPQNFWTIVNCYFTSWKYRLSAITAEQYLEDIDINFNYLYECNDEQKMYVLQFVDSYVFFLINNYKISRENIKDDNTYNPYITIIDNIGHIIKNLNFKRECDNQKEHITYIKRDADVDSVLTILEKEEDLRLALLEYNDFRIEKDKDSKKQIITKIGQYIELNKDKYKETNNTLYKNISDILNNFNIRHSNDKQIVVRDIDIIPIYDTCFKMMIHLIRDEYVKNSYKVLIDMYRPKENNKED